MDRELFKHLKSNYEKACNAIIEAFSEEYGVQAGKEDWVAGEVGTLICVNDEFFISMEDIMLMLRMGMKWDGFLEWWDYNTDASFLGLNHINLRSWLMGAPRLGKEQIDGLKAKRTELDSLIKDANEKF